MRHIRFFLLVMSFFIEVHVRAQECVGKSVPCAFQSHAVRRIVDLKGAQVVLAPGAVVEHRSEAQLHILQGVVYVHTSSGFKFSSAFGDANCEQGCRAIFSRTDNAFKIETLRGEWSVQRRGDKQHYAVGVATQVEMGEVGLDGKAVMGFPQSLSWDAIVKSWAKLYLGKKEDFKEDILTFHAEWKLAVERVAEMQRQEAGRLIASENHKKSLVWEKKKAAEREDESLRKMFREKNYLFP